MALKEKSKKKPNEISAVLSKFYTFSEVVDDACDKLMDCRIKYTIRRIHEMKECLCNIEKELDAFFKSKAEN